MSLHGSKFVFVIFLIVTFLVIFTNPVFANVGVFSSQHRITGSLWPQTSTTIEAEQGVLTLDFITEKRWLNSVKVEANYSLFNHSEHPENITVGFPVPSYVTSAEILLGDKVVDFHFSEVGLEGLSTIDAEDRNWLQESIVWQDPLIKEEYTEHEVEVWKKINILIFDFLLMPWKKQI